MPIMSSDGLKIDYTEDGAGEAVILIHSSVSGNRQWKRLVHELKNRFRVLAPNLYGYGETTGWQEDGTQTLANHVALIEAVCDSVLGPIRLVGHSFGGSVALKVAADLGERVSHLALYEPNPFYLLQSDGRREAFAEAMALHDDVKSLGKRGDWMMLAERFAEYFSGDGSWASFSTRRIRNDRLGLTPSVALKYWASAHGLNPPVAVAHGTFLPGGPLVRHRIHS